MHYQSGNDMYSDSNNLGAYLAGLLEGDGYIEMGSNSNEKKRPNPRFVFTFHKNNLALFKRLKTSISYCFFKEEGGNTMRYVIADTQGVIKLTHMMNGYFRTPKIQTFHRLIDWLNTNHSLNIAKLPLNTSGQ